MYEWLNDENEGLLYFEGFRRCNLVCVDMYTSHRQLVKLLLGDDLLTQGIVLLDLWIGYSELLKK